MHDINEPLTSANPSTRIPPKPQSKPAYSDKLNKDGRITEAERQHRFANNLCLYCGGPGHVTATCPKKAAGARGRAAEVVPDEEDPPEEADEVEPILELEEDYDDSKN